MCRGDFDPARAGGMRFLFRCVLAMPLTALLLAVRKHLTRRFNRVPLHFTAQSLITDQALDLIRCRKLIPEFYF